MSDFGRILKKLRQNHNITQEQLAKSINMTKGAVSNYELGERTPPPDVLIALARVFGVSVDYLLGVGDKRKMLDVNGLSNDEIQFLQLAIKLLKKHHK